MRPAGFDAWLNTFVAEKGLDTEHVFTVRGPQWGANLIPLACVLDAAKVAGPDEQVRIRHILTVIDYKNGDPMHFFKYLACGIAR